MISRSILALLTAILVPLEAIAGESGMNWIKLKPVGDQDKPLFIIWITPVQEGQQEAEFAAAFRPLIKEVGGHRVVPLPPAEYNKVAALTQERKCPAASIDELSKFGTIELSHSANGQEHVICLLSKNGACDYFLDVLKLSEEQGISNLIPSIADFERRLGCRASTIDAPG
jgi:hypothetical protein